LQEIDSSKVGMQGKALNDEELNILGQYLKQQGDQSLRGTVYKPYGGGQDVVFGVIKDRNWKGQTEYLVMNDSAKNGKGRFRLHSTPITSDQIIETKSQPTDIYNQATKGVDPLLEEARKYKSAEEFVKAQGEKFIHETNAPDIKEFKLGKAGENTQDSWLGKGVYFQKDGTFKIEKYGKNKVEAYLKPDTKIFKIKETPN
jgi:hypothetical protein